MLSDPNTDARLAEEQGERAAEQLLVSNSLAGSHQSKLRYFTAGFNRVALPYEFQLFPHPNPAPHAPSWWWKLKSWWRRHFRRKAKGVSPNIT